MNWLTKSKEQSIIIFKYKTFFRAFIFAAANRGRKLGVFDWAKENIKLNKVKNKSQTRRRSFSNQTEKIETQKKYFSLSNSATSAQKKNISKLKSPNWNSRLWTGEAETLYPFCFSPKLARAERRRRFFCSQKKSERNSTLFISKKRQNDKTPFVRLFSREKCTFFLPFFHSLPFFSFSLEFSQKCIRNP